MAENNEFKGSTKEALKNIQVKQQETQEDIKELGEDLKKYCATNDKEHREFVVALTKISARKIPWKFWGAIGAALIASFTSFAIVLIAVIFT